MARQPPGDQKQGRLGQAVGQDIDPAQQGNQDDKTHLGHGAPGQQPFGVVIPEGKDDSEQGAGQSDPGQWTAESRNRSPQSEHRGDGGGLQHAGQQGGDLFRGLGLGEGQPGAAQKQA